MSAIFQGVCRHFKATRVLGIAKQCQHMCYSAGQTLTDGEKRIVTILKDKFPNATHVLVQDISGGCGAMYEIQIESDDFKGKRTVMQHRMVNQALAEEIKDMHGLRINTSVPNT